MKRLTGQFFCDNRPKFHRNQKKSDFLTLICPEVVTSDYCQALRLKGLAAI